MVSTRTADYRSDAPRRQAYNSRQSPENVRPRRFKVRFWYLRCLSYCSNHFDFNYVLWLTSLNIGKSWQVCQYWLNSCTLTQEWGLNYCFLDFGCKFDSILIIWAHPCNFFWSLTWVNWRWHGTMRLPSDYWHPRIHCSKLWIFDIIEKQLY